jgi:hypothetical protein
MWERPISHYPERIVNVDGANNMIVNANVLFVK